jgi:hypothetical protein
MIRRDLWAFNYGLGHIRKRDTQSQKVEVLCSSHLGPQFLHRGLRLAGVLPDDVSQFIIDSLRSTIEMFFFEVFFLIA